VACVGLAALAIEGTSRALSTPTTVAPVFIRSHDVRLGAHISANGELGAPAEAAVLDHFAAMVGGNPDIIETFKNPTRTLLSPGEIANLETRGQTPMVTWELYKSGWSGPTMALQAIVKGRYDDAFRRASGLAKSFPGEVIIRPGQEMNGNWYGWSGHPVAFKKAWRHIVRLFRREGADNVKWAWTPNIDLGNYPFAEYFPGDAWVDYVGLDGYNWGLEGPGTDEWRSFYGVFAASYDQITELSSRPVIIAETSSSEDGGSKARWIRKGFLRTIPNDFPRIAAVVWFNYNKEEDWRVNSSKASLEAFRQVVASTLYIKAEN
jgi:beta-mannanase